MALYDEVADRMAQRVMAVIQKTGDERIERRVAQELGSSSPTLEEAFLTAMRIRKAEQRGLSLVEKCERGEELPVAQISSQPQDDGGH